MCAPQQNTSQNVFSLIVAVGLVGVTIYYAYATLNSLDDTYNNSIKVGDVVIGTYTEFIDPPTIVLIVTLNIFGILLYVVVDVVNTIMSVCNNHSFTKLSIIISNSALVFVVVPLIMMCYNISDPTNVVDYTDTYLEHWTWYDIHSSSMFPWFDPDNHQFTVASDRPLVSKYCQDFTTGRYNLTLCGADVDFKNDDAYYRSVSNNIAYGIFIGVVVGLTFINGMTKLDCCCCSVCSYPAGSGGTYSSRGIGVAGLVGTTDRSSGTGGTSHKSNVSKHSKYGHHGSSSVYSSNFGRVGTSSYKPSHHTSSFTPSFHSHTSHHSSGFSSGGFGGGHHSGGGHHG